jgi:hypothetical protein
MLARIVAATSHDVSVPDVQQAAIRSAEVALFTSRGVSVSDVQQAATRSAEDAVISPGLRPPEEVEVASSYGLMAS